MSNQIDCNNLVAQIGLHFIFWILADAWRQIWAGRFALAGRIALQFYSAVARVI